MFPLELYDTIENVEATNASKMSKAEINAQGEGDSEEAPIRMESLSNTPSTIPESKPARPSPEDAALSDLTSAVSSTYTSFTNFLNRGATDITEATRKLPSQFHSLAAGGTTMVSKLTGGITDLISHGMPGLDEDGEIQEPSFEYLQKTYGIANSDSLIASFLCHLKQTYGPNQNSFSPDIQMSFPMLVSVTEEALCVAVKHSGSEYPGKMSRDEIVSISDKAEEIVITLSDGREAVLTEFRNSELKLHAFKLMQHLTHST